MSARKPPLPRNKPVFNVHDYEKIGYAEAEIEEAKTAFDLLDIEGTGKIDAAGTSETT